MYDKKNQDLNKLCRIRISLLQIFTFLILQFSFHVSTAENKGKNRKHFPWIRKWKSFIAPGAKFRDAVRLDHLIKPISSPKKRRKKNLWHIVCTFKWKNLQKRFSEFQLIKYATLCELQLFLSSFCLLRR